MHTSDLIEIDEHGYRINNNGIHIETSLLSVGMKTYALDSVYTELMLEQQKTGRVKIVGFRKGMIGEDQKQISWDKKHPHIRYGYDYTYYDKSYEYKILSLEDHHIPPACCLVSTENIFCVRSQGFCRDSV